MRDKILSTSADLFLNLGFKSVTMDDIANKIGISKKTIYQHYTTKTKLVEATTLFVFDNISKSIDDIRATYQNPIEELLEIKKIVMMHLKNEKTSPQYQLHKYYPKIYSTIKTKQFDLISECTISNLERGVETGLYRKDIHIDFVSRLYFSSLTSFKDAELFPHKSFSMSMLLDHFLDYHLRGICTPKGIERLDQYVSKNQS
ncbi:MAG: TetR/AcrR family transcriptional regulator [Aestuariibaculum sp.]